MTQAQKTELHNLDRKQRKGGLNKNEQKRRAILRNIESSEVNALASKLSNRFNSKHNTSVIPYTFGKLSNVYVNDVL